MFAHADIQGWFLCDTEGAAQWGDIQHATQPTRASCNGRPLGVLAPALVARLMVVLSEKKPVLLILIQPRRESHVGRRSYTVFPLLVHYRKGGYAMGARVVDSKMRGRYRVRGTLPVDSRHNFWNLSVDSLLRVDTNIFFIVVLASQPSAGEEVSARVYASSRCPFRSSSASLVLLLSLCWRLFVQHKLAISSIECFSSASCHHILSHSLPLSIVNPARHVPVATSRKLRQVGTKIKRVRSCRWKRGGHSCGEDIIFSCAEVFMYTDLGQSTMSQRRQS
jgi:hypothetical protein